MEKNQVFLVAIVVVFFKFGPHLLNLNPTLLQSCLSETCWSYILVSLGRMNKKKVALTLMSSLLNVADQFLTKILANL